MSEDHVCATHGAYTPRFERMRGVEVRIDCPKCAIDSFKRISLAEIAKQSHLREQASRESIGIPPIHHVATLRNSAHQDSIREWLASGSGNLVLLGTTGTGKSYLACAALIEAAKAGRRCRYTTVADFILAIRETWDSREKRERDVYGPLIGADLLAFDELGASGTSESDALKVQHVIAARYDRGLPSIFISNLSPSALKQAIGERAYDRIRHQCTQINLVGDSRRRPSTATSKATGRAGPGVQAGAR